VGLVAPVLVIMVALGGLPVWGPFLLLLWIKKRRQQERPAVAASIWRRLVRRSRRRPFGPVAKVIWHHTGREPADAAASLDDHGHRRGRTRTGVLVTVTITAALLWWAAVASWWSADAYLLSPTVYLGTLHGTVFVWLSLVACAAYGVAALPVPELARRASAILGLICALAAASVLAVLSVRLLQYDAVVHQAWAPAAWANYLSTRAAGSPFDGAASSSPGMIPAMVAAFILLMLGMLLLVPRRHERTVLIVSTMVLITASLLLPATAWRTSGPHTVQRGWMWLPTYLTGSWPNPQYFDEPSWPHWAWLEVAVLASNVVLLGTGLFLRPRPGIPPHWSRLWSWTLGISWALVFAAVGFLLNNAAITDTTSLSMGETDQGAGLNGPLFLAMILPLIVAIRGCRASKPHSSSSQTRDWVARKAAMIAVAGSGGENDISMRKIPPTDR
jgi:hypothetical protein